jgi:hypothetical protein
MVRLELNVPLGDEKFMLPQPPAAEVVHLDKAGIDSTAGSPNHR